MLLIHAKGVYDNETRSLIGDSLLVDVDRIVGIGMFADLKEHVDTKTELYHLEDLYLFPGLINTHVHLEFDSTTSARVHYISQPPQVRMGRALAQAQTMLLSGVTTVRDAGSSWEMLDITDSSLAALYKLPRLQLCGPPITVTGGHLNFMECEADSHEELVTSVRLHQKRGCSAIKMMVTGGQMTPGSLPERVSYSPEDISVLVDESKRLGLPTVAHCLTTDGFINCMEGNIDSIEHCACFVRNQSNRLLERIYEPKIMEQYRGQSRFFMNGLAASYHTFDRVRAGIDKPNESQIFWLEQEERMFAIFRKLIELGMKPVVGTDAGVSNTYFDETWLELELMCSRGGQSEADVIDIATVNGATCLGMEQEVGKLKVGYKADVIGLVDNPLENIAAFRHVPWIMRDGIIVKG
ncbi:MAG: amidohydrolase family protein [Sphaerochaetaceae bacterium]|nr:amidohydrolase family protein [Sphaerochaetaceae bacterium]